MLTDVTTAGPPLLETVLADWRAKARVLDGAGHANDARLLDDFADAVAAAAEDYLRWVSEADARLRTGWSVDRLRARWHELAKEGHAEMRGRVRYYRALVLPRRPDVAAARARGLRGEGAA